MIMPKFIVLILFSIQFLATGCVMNKQENNNDQTKNQLFIHFQSGFAGEQVILSSSQVIYYSGTVKTNNMTGFAYEQEIEYLTGDILTLRLPSENIQATISPDPAAGSYLGINLLENKIIFSQQKEPFGYD